MSKAELGCPQCREWAKMMLDHNMDRPHPACTCHCCGESEGRVFDDQKSHNASRAATLDTP